MKQLLNLARQLTLLILMMVLVQMSYSQNPIDAGDNQNVCGDTYTLNASLPEACVGVWTVLGGTATIVEPTNPQTKITNLGVGYNTFKWTVSGKAMGEDYVVITNLKMTVSAGNDKVICEDNALLNAAQSLGAGTWTVVAGSATIVNATSVFTTVKNLSAGDNVFRWSVNVQGCISTDELVVRFQKPVISAGMAQTICGSETQLSASKPVNANGKWQITAGGGTLVNMYDPATKVTNLSQGTNEFLWTVSDGVCTASDKVIVVSNPVEAFAGVDFAVCSNQVQLNAKAPITGASAYWAVVAGNGTFTDAKLYNSYITDLKGGTNIFRWTVASNGCSASSDVMVIYNKVEANAGTYQYVCGSEANLQATMPLAGVGYWTISGGTATIVNATLPNSVLTNLSLGANKFVWNVINGNCRAESAVVIFNNKVEALVGADVQVCGQDAILVAQAPALGKGFWTNLGTSAIIADVNALSTKVTQLATGTNVFRWTVTNANCVSSKELTVTSITGTSLLASAGTDQSVCGVSATLAANDVSAQGATGTWSVIGNSTASISNVNLFNTQVTNLQVGANAFRWNVSKGNCNSSDEVIITNNKPLAIATASADVCTMDGVLNANPTPNARGLWTSLNPAVKIEFPEQAITKVHGLVSGTNTFVWTIYNPACPTATTSINVSINSMQVAVSAGQDQQTCFSSATMTATVPASNYRGTWQVVEGTGTFTNINAYNSTVKDLRQGINRFAWIVSNGICESTSRVTINNTGVMVQTLPSMTVCDSIAYIAAPPTSSATGLWTATNTSIVIEKANSAYTKVSGLKAGENTFKWIVSNGSCSSISVLNVIKNSTLATVSAGLDQTVCILETNMNATPPPAGATGQWVVVYGNGTFANPTLNTTNVINLAQGENRFAWIVRNGDCKAYDEVIVTRNEASKAVATSQTVCSNTAVLAANTPLFGTGKWTTSNSSIVIDNSQSAVTQVSNLPTGASTFYWTITNGACTNATSVIINNNSFTVDAGADQTTCGGYVQMNGKTSATNINWQVIYGAAYVQTPNSLTTMLGQLVGNTIVLRLTAELGGCKAYDDMVINNNQVLAAAGENVAICGTEYQLAGNAPTKGTGLWSVVGGTGTFANSSIYNTTVTGLGTTNTLRWTINNNGCTSFSDIVLTTQSTATMGTFDAGLATQTACGDVQLAGTLPIGNMSGRWRMVSGEGIFDNPSVGNTIVRNLRLGFNTLRWQITGNLLGCTRSKDITINYVGTTSKVVMPVLTVCEPNAQLLAMTPSFGTGVWTASGTTATIDNNTRFNAMVSNLKVGENKFIWKVSTTLSTCFSQSTVIVNYQPVLLNVIADQETCSTTATIINTNTQQGYWQVLSGSATIVNATTINVIVTNIPQGVTMLRYNVQSGACRGIADVKITNRQPVDVFVEPDKVVCEPNVVLSANRLSLGVGEWASKGAAVVVDRTNFTTQITGLVNGVNQFTWTVSIPALANCYIQKTVSVTRNVVTANVGSNQSVCATTATLNATGSGFWTVIGGNAIVVNSTLNNSAVTNLSNGMNTFLWNTYQGVCKASAMVNINNLSIKADGGYDIQTCDNMVKLSARITENLTQGYWNVSSGTGVIENQTMAQTVVKNLPIGLSTLTWTAVSGNCVDRDVVNITVNTPSIANAGTDQVITTATAFLAAITPSIGTGYWQKVTGTGVIANLSLGNSSLSGLSTGINIFRWIVSNGICTSVDEVVYLKIDGTISAGINQTVCANQTKLGGVVPIGAKSTWKLVSGQGSIVNATSSSTYVTNLGRGLNTFALIVDVNGSISTSSVNIESRDIKAFAGANQVVCEDNVVLKANILKDVMQGTWSVMEGNGVIENETAFESKVVNLARGRNVFRWTMQNNQCADYAEVIIYNQTIDVPTNGYTLDGNTFKYVGIVDTKVDSWYWDLNDGSYSTAINPNHTYQKEGMYQICLTLANKVSGCISRDCGTIAIGTTQSVMTDKLNFDYSLVPMGDYTKLILTNPATGFDNFVWDFGDGKFEAFKEGTHIYTQSGFFKVCLRAKANGTVFTQCKDIAIETKKEVLNADFNFFINPTLPTNTIAFRNSASENVRRFQWDFGDGRMDSVANPVHVFPKAGYYNVCLKVYNDSLKAVAQKCMEVQVLASATNYCQAKFEYQIDPVTQQVMLSNKSLGVITDYQWDLGDGKPMTIKEPAAFKFPKAGVYKVILKVKNAATLCYSEYATTIAIGTVNQQVNKLDFASYVNRDNDTVYFKDASMGLMKRMLWYFGDGEKLEGFAPAHKYAKAGTYNVCVSAMDSVQQYYQLCKEVTVYDKNNIGVDTKAMFAYFIDTDNQTVRFVDKSVGNVSKWTWDFGNRQYAMTQNPVYSFNVGNYAVCLNIFDAATTKVSRYCENIMIKGKDFATKVVDARFATFVDAKRLIVKDETVGDASKWYWTFGDGEYTSTLSSGTLAHLYKGAGTYEVCLIAFDKLSAAQSKLCKPIFIDEPCKVKADFTYFIDNQTNTLVLKDASTGVMSSYYYWNFGDNKTSTEANVKHVYAKPAIYNVTFAAIDANNKLCVDKISKVIAIGQLSISADFDYFVDETTNSIRFINKSVGNIFYWKFDDGGSSMEKEPTYAFKEAGIHLVTLVVSDTYGRMSRKELRIQVGKVDCSANFTMFIDSLTNTVRFKNMVLSTTVAVNTNIKMYWEFGDGGTSSELNPVYRYQTAGYRKVTLTTNAANCMDKHTEVVVIGNEGKGCYSDFEYQIDGAKLKLFDKSGGDIMYYVWNFGDQSANVVNVQNPEHTFVKAGYFNVCLTAVNTKGISNLKCKSIKILPTGATDNLLKADFVYTVDSVSKTINTYDKSKGEPNKWTWIYPNKTDILQNSTYTAQDTGYVLVKFYVENTTLLSKSYVAQLIKVGTKFSGIKAAFTLQARATSQKAGGYPVDMTGAAFGDPAKMVWDFGDGTIDSTSTNPSHVYTTAGTYTVCLTATDPETSTVTKTCEQFVVTGINEEVSAEIIGALSAYPNPFDTETTIAYGLIQNGNIELAVYNLLGDKLMILKSGYTDKGSYNFKWNSGALKSGMYLLKLRTDNGELTNKLIINK